jgi:alkylhydroperoxidase/carboxymuconolactone decarboxylase family protein YurZ
MERRGDYSMDEHTEIFIALGAATAANCGPCFEHYFSRAEKLGIGEEDIQKSVDIAVKVRGGAHMVMKENIQKIMKRNATRGENCCSGASSCCD